MMRWIVLWYLAASAVAFVAYARDKHAARHARWRVRERTLHLIALAGGWPGALVAQRTLRHKTRDRRFLAVFWLTVAAHAVFWGWLAFR